MQCAITVDVVCDYAVLKQNNVDCEKKTKTHTQTKKQIKQAVIFK